MHDGSPLGVSLNSHQEAKELIFGDNNFKYQLQEFLKSDRREMTILLYGKTRVGTSHLTNPLKRGCQHPSNKFEILWQVAQNSFSLLLSYFVAQYVLIIVV